ncbi:MAG: methyltransferase domain-containing protein [Nitriliruptor sp.]|nr:MAG: methyltransferase domain-containing protein [Nitriliruptor sp.]
MSPSGAGRDTGSAPGAPTGVHGGDASGLAARLAAWTALTRVEEDGAWSNLAVPEAIAHLPNARDRGFAAHLAYETLRWEGTLDAALLLVLSRPLEDVEPGLRRVLRLGATQLLVSDVPARAAVDTSVQLARRAVPQRRSAGAGGFVNGVLRALARRDGDLGWPDRDQDPVGNLSLSTAHPAWVVEDLLPRFGLERTAAILAADDVAPGVTLRANGDRDALLAELVAAGIDARAGATPVSVRAPGADPRTLAAVTQGRAVVQDEASVRVALATGASHGDRVLDLCAGPGGKTTHLAHLVGPTGRVTAVELHPHRARLITEAARRQGVTVEVEVGDARTPPVAEDARFEVVLLDAPCTGLGTGRRRPEVRWRRSRADATELAGLQGELLRAAARYVAPGGQLTYAVCTWTAAETTEVVEGFAPVAATAGLTPTGSIQLLPDSDDTDGMFIATWQAG